MPFIILRNDYEPDSPRQKCFFGEPCSGLVCLRSCLLRLLLWAELAGFLTAEWFCVTELFPRLGSCWGGVLCDFWFFVLWVFFFKVNFLGTGETGEFLYTIKHAECFKGRRKVSLRPSDLGKPVCSLESFKYLCCSSQLQLRTSVLEKRSPAALFPPCSGPHCSFSHLYGV